ncbi:hypothetical protein [Streptomyces tateyamensis]|uniref:hypothetical protein n=1 Tax=Streptomyces tateyamensis TaxID=565073 RepID=UPI0015E8E2E9|nr:hypothetical protein [Streptomyces tateyamensis]
MVDDGRPCRADQNGELRRAQAQLRAPDEPVTIALTERQAAEQVPATPWQAIGQGT